MAGARYAPHKTADDVIHRPDRMQVKLSQSDDGWALEGLPFTMTQLGYPNLEDSAGPGRVLSNSLNEANHYLFLCEQRILASQQPHGRRFESFLN
jgi:hypothetical protein